MVMMIIDVFVIKFMTVTRHCVIILVKSLKIERRNKQCSASSALSFSGIFVGFASSATSFFGSFVGSVSSETIAVLSCGGFVGSASSACFVISYLKV